jgi:hypothetical protein
MATEKREWSEEIEIAGHELVEKVKELVKEGRARKLILRRENGDVIVEIPLNTGIAVGGAAALIAPLIAGLGAMAAILSRVRIEIVKEENIE